MHSWIVRSSPNLRCLQFENQLLPLTTFCIRPFVVVVVVRFFSSTHNFLLNRIHMHNQCQCIHENTVWNVNWWAKKTENDKKKESAIAAAVATHVRTHMWNGAKTHDIDRHHSTELRHFAWHLMEIYFKKKWFFFVSRARQSRCKFDTHTHTWNTHAQHWQFEQTNRTNKYNRKILIIFSCCLVAFT